MSDRAIFLDRDDTLIEDPGYISDPGQVRLINGVAEALVELRKMGYKLVVVTNQSGLARGIITEEALDRVHHRLQQLLAERYASLDRIYYCPYHPEGIVEKYRRESDRRKPEPGMLLKAADQMNIDLQASWMIGNSARDIEAGRKAGCKTILIDDLLHTKTLEKNDTGADYQAVNIKEAVNIIKQQHRTQAHRPTDNQADNNPQAGPALYSNEETGWAESDRGKEMEEKSMQENFSDPAAEQLLNDILEQLKRMQRDEMFGEFSIMRMLAGILQIAVPFCLLVTVWFLMNPDAKSNAVFTTLGFAVVLQLMALTFYIMQGRK